MKMKIRRLWFLGLLLAVIASPGSPRAEDDDVAATIPKLAENTALLKFRRELLRMDVQPWPLSYLASTYPFRAINLNVYSLGQVREYLAEGELKKLADFSRSAMRALG